MLAACITKYYADGGSNDFGDGGIKVAIFNQQFYKENIKQEVDDDRNKIPEQLHMTFYNRLRPHNIF